MTGRLLQLFPVGLKVVPPRPGAPRVACRGTPEDYLRLADELEGKRRKRDREYRRRAKARRKGFPS